MFDSDGYLSEMFLVIQAEAFCETWLVEGCDLEEIWSAATGLDRSVITGAQLGVVTMTLIEAAAVAKPTAVRGEQLDRMTGGLLATAMASSADEPVVREMVDQCTRSVAAKLVGFINGKHPCEVMPTFMPGGDSPQATSHKTWAIMQDPTRATAVYGHVVPGRWYWNKVPTCMPDTRAAAALALEGPVDCDEFPYGSTTTAGPGASVRPILRSDNRREGSHLQWFYNGRCKPRLKGAHERFMIVPMDYEGAPDGGYLCPSG